MRGQTHCNLCDCDRFTAYVYQSPNCTCNHAAVEHSHLSNHVVMSVEEHKKLFRCPGCKSTGFEVSVLGDQRCTFCDGTDGGNPPTMREILDAMPPIYWMAYDEAGDVYAIDLDANALVHNILRDGLSWSEWLLMDVISFQGEL